MDNEPIITNYGILASISWNSNKWAGEPTSRDLAKSNYDFVKDNAHMHESLNFGHEIFPSEHDGYYIGYTPMFNKLPDALKSSNVEVVFFTSSDYENNNQKSIIGIYGFPEIDAWFPRTAEHKLFEKYDGGNICALKEDIIFFQNPVVFNNNTVIIDNLLPDGKQISKQGFNYLNSDNVYNLLVLAQSKNPNNKKLRKFIMRFPLMVEFVKEKIDLLDFINLVGETSANNIDDIKRLEQKMIGTTPELKYRVSSFIERGSIANRVKSLSNFKCLICESLGLNPHSFVKKNGEFFVETHHVHQVATLAEGVLRISNLITVCPNHHRQLHYGNSSLIEDEENHFKFVIDDSEVVVAKIKI